MNDCSSGIEGSRMKALLIESPESVVLGIVPKPTLRSTNDIVIKVKAAGVNRADVLQKKGKDS